MRDRWPYIAITIVTALIAAVLWPTRLSYPIDDTFITFRYVEHLAQGHGLVWNIGDAPTEGYTNFLYVLLLTPFSAMGVDLLLASQLLNVLAVLIAAIYIYRAAALLAGHQGGQRIALLAPAIFLATPATWANAFSGMETVVFAALVIAALYHTLRRPTRFIGYLLLFLAALTRPEGAAIALVVGFFDVFGQDKRRVLRSFFLGFILPLVLYYVAKRLYFGHWLPNSFSVKVVQAVGEEQGFLQGLQAVRLFLGRVWPLFLLTIVPLFFGAKRTYVPALASAILLIAAYAVPAPLMGFFDRFFHASEVILITLAGASILLLAQRFGNREALMASGVILALAVFTNTQSPRAKEILTWDLDEINERLEMIAQDLRHLPHAETITFATSDAGIMPYFSRMRHLDLAGLNESVIAHASTEAEVVDRIMQRRPELLLLGADWSPLGAEDTCRTISRKVHGKLSTAVDRLLKDERFQQYRPTAAYLTGVYDYAVLIDTRSATFSALDSAYLARINSNLFFIKRLTCIN